MMIDGRAGLAAHGAPMPLFGGKLTGAAVTLPDAEGQPVITTSRVAAIVAWLADHQREATP
jgi:hypothetical protein